jgi:hypothetical protein
MGKGKSFLDILKSKLLRKADEIEQPAESGGDDMQVDSVIAEVVDKFNEGSLSPDVEEVKAYIVEKGIDEAQAEEIATTVIDSYFANEDENSESMTDEPAEPMPDEEIKSTIKWINSQKGFTEILAKSQIEILNRLSLVTSKLRLLEKSFSEASGVPVNQKQPVFSKSTIAKSNQNQSEFEQNCDLLLKGVLAGKFTTEHLTLYESKRELTKEANQYLNSLKLEGK